MLKFDNIDFEKYVSDIKSCLINDNLEYIKVGFSDIKESESIKTFALIIDIGDNYESYYHIYIDSYISKKENKVEYKIVIYNQYNIDIPVDMVFKDPKHLKEKLDEFLYEISELNNLDIANIVYNFGNNFIVDNYQNVYCPYCEKITYCDDSKLNESKILICDNCGHKIKAMAYAESDKCKTELVSDHIDELIMHMSNEEHHEFSNIKYFYKQRTQRLLHYDSEYIETIKNYIKQEILFDMINLFKFNDYYSKERYCVDIKKIMIETEGFIIPMPKNKDKKKHLIKLLKEIDEYL